MSRVLGFFALAVVTVIFSGCGSKDDSQVRPALTATGAFLTPGAADKPVDNVTLSMITDPAKLDEAVALLPKLSSVKNINAQGVQLTDAHVEILSKIPSLISLTLSETAVTDAGVQHLAGSGKLISLALYGTAITDNALPDIAKISTLNILNVGKTQVAGDLAPLANLKELEWLVAVELPGGLPDGIADTLGGLPKFAHLQITNTPVSDSALEKLRTLKKGITID